MSKQIRPVIIPTALSSGTMLWTAVLILYFLAASAAYTAWCRLSAAEKRLAEPSRIHVEAELFHCTLPESAVRYSLEGNRLAVFFDATNDVPAMVVRASRNPAIAYRAIDANPVFGIMHVRRELEDLGFDTGSGIADAPTVIGSDFAPVKPGVIAARTYFNFGAGEGISYCFALGDTSYGALLFWNDAERYGLEVLRTKILKFFDGLELIASPDRFARPNVNSATLTAADHERIISEAERERVLWRMFADRVATEPDTALVSAIEHFRKLLALKSSVLEEREILESEDFRRYEKLLERREAVVGEWFVLLDKYVAIGDDAAAREQAEFIRRHATLIEESLDCRRAAAIGAKLAAREAAKQKGR